MTAKVGANLVSRVVSAVVNAIVGEVSPLLIPFEGLIDSLGPESQRFPDLDVRKLLFELELDDLCHLKGVDLVIDPGALLLFFTLALLQRQPPPLKLLVESNYILQQCSLLFCEPKIQFSLSFTGHHL